MIVVNPTGFIGTTRGMVLSWSSKIDLQILHTSDNQIDVIKIGNWIGCYLRFMDVLIGLKNM